MARKNVFSSSLMTAENRTSPESNHEAPSKRADTHAPLEFRTPPPSFTGRGAFGAASRSIDHLVAQADAAKDIEAKLTNGETVVDLDPDAIDSSFVPDRLSRDDDHFKALVSAIESRGQDSAILVRPHPEKSGRYQIAFGHRRARAAKLLGRQVRAVVKNLSDRDLILAQGQENSARADLSFIERALFARRLEDSGYDRELIMSALAVDKWAISKMIIVATRIEIPLIEAVGPAPGVGRDRWVELANMFEGRSDAGRFLDVLRSESSQALTSDERFEMLGTLAREANAGDHQGRKKPAKRKEQFWSNPAGLRVAKINSAGKTFVVAINKRHAPGFGDYLVSQMDALYEQFTNDRKEEPND